VCGGATILKKGALSGGERLSGYQAEGPNEFLTKRNTKFVPRGRGRNRNSAQGGSRVQFIP
jgi:hypothetical protein